MKMIWAMLPLLAVVIVSGCAGLKTNATKEKFSLVKQNEPLAPDGITDNNH